MVKKSEDIPGIRYIFSFKISGTRLSIKLPSLSYFYQFLIDFIKKKSLISLKRLLNSSNEEESSDIDSSQFILSSRHRTSSILATNT